MHPSGSGVYIQLLKAMVDCWNSSTSIYMVVTRFESVLTCCEYIYISVQKHGSKKLGYLRIYRKCSGVGVISTRSHHWAVSL